MWFSGFRVTNRGCCGIGRNGGQVTCLPFQTPCPNRDEYVFWDAFHPTSKVNIIVGRRAFNGGLDVVYPMNIQQLAALNLQPNWISWINLLYVFFLNYTLRVISNVMLLAMFSFYNEYGEFHCCTSLKEAGLCVWCVLVMCAVVYAWHGMAWLMSSF